MQYFPNVMHYLRALTTPSIRMKEYLVEFKIVFTIRLKKL